MNIAFLSNKKIVFFLLALLVGLLTAGGAYIYWQQGKEAKMTSPVGEESPLAEKKDKDQILEDIWGLKVFYPGELVVQAATRSGELTRYNFTHPDRSGYLTIYTKETDATTVEEWLKRDKESATVAGMLDTTIGGKSGKKMRFIGSKELRALTVDTWQVFIFEVFPEEDDEYWDPVFSSILAKYEFLPFEDEVAQENGEPAAEVPAPGGGNVIEYPEEVIE